MYSEAERKDLLLHLGYRGYRSPKGSLIWSFQAPLADLAASKRASNIKADRIGPKWTLEFLAGPYFTVLEKRESDHYIVELSLGAGWYRGGFHGWRCKEVFTLRPPSAESVPTYPEGSTFSILMRHLFASLTAGLGHGICLSMAQHGSPFSSPTSCSSIFSFTTPSSLPLPYCSCSFYLWLFNSISKSYTFKLIWWTV